MIFQDPYSSLDPRMNIGQVLEVHTGWLAKQGWKIEGEPEWLKHMPNFPKESGPTRLATPVWTSRT